MKFGPVVSEKMSFRIFLIWNSDGPFVLWSEIICAVLVEGYQEEQFCEIIFEFGPVVQEKMSFKIFLIWSSGGPPVQWSETINANLKEGIMGNNHVKLYEIWTCGLGEDVL